MPEPRTQAPPRQRATAWHHLSHRRTLRWAIPIIVLLLAFLFRNTLLGSVGAYLVVEDEARPVDAIYVLSGNPDDRGREAAQLFQAGYAPEVVCLGGEENSALQLYNVNVLTASMTQRVLHIHGVPDSVIRLLPYGTSTFEEFEAITEDCKEHKYNEIMVVSSRFHTRRIHTFFRLRLHFEGISMVLRGARESSFEESAWWQEESGLLFVNNEYIKMGYYWLKY